LNLAVLILNSVTTSPAAGVQRSRLDALLLDRGLVRSREAARASVLAREVRVDGAAVTRPGAMVAATATIELVGGPRFVSRGGDKLAHALQAFDLEVGGLTCVDVGASTGGFTDCLLQHGATHVFAVDVGYGLIDYGLRQDARVTLLERTNARHLAPLPRPCDLAVIDVSFIGLEKVIPAVERSLRSGGEIVCLVKPQFQARREEVGKRGVVRDPQVHAAVLGRVVAWAAERGLRLLGLTTSPLIGPAGNREFFLHLRLPAEGGADA
jgi:23S rRNA (cytidine1920-2'-O)/16S rRNA (cytidine1409-2'-O)-methyltransferase